MPEPQSTALAPAIINFDTLIRGEMRDFVMEFVLKSTTLKDKHRYTWDEVLENYMVLPAGWHQTIAFHPRVPNHSRLQSRSVLKDPETHQIVETLASQGLGLLMPRRGAFIQAVPKGEDDRDKSDVLSNLLMSVLRSPGVPRTIYQLLKDAFIFGTSVLELTWETRTRYEMVPVPSFSPEGEFLGKEYAPQEVIYRDRPMFRPVDIYDFYPDPSGTRIHEDMVGVAKRFRTTRHAVEAMYRGEIYDAEPSIRAVEVAGREGSDGQDGLGKQRFAADEPKDLPSKFGQMRGFEYWGYYPGRLSKRDPYRNRVITLLEDQVVRSRINPFMGGDIPFKEIVVNPIQGRFYGLGPAEVVRFQQDSTDSMNMTITDAVNLMTNPNLLVGINFRGDTDELRRRAFNGIIECHDPTAIGLIPQDFGAIAIGQQEIVRRKQGMRESSGAANPLQAIEGGDRQTATEVSTLTRFASQRIDSVVSLMEADDYPWIGRRVHGLLRQFANEIILSKLRGQRLEVPLEMIDFDADVEFIGSRQAQTQFQQLMANKEAVNILGTNPDVVEQYPDLVEVMLEALEIPDAKHQVARAVEVAQQRRAFEAAMAQQLAKKFPEGGLGSTQNNAITSGEADFGTEVGETEKQGQAVA